MCQIKHRKLPLSVHQVSYSAFTLAELLIALGILGIIATFTIPKVLIAQQNGKYKAIGKEATGMVSGAFTAYQKNNVISANTKIADLTPYMNYANVDTATIVDYVSTQGTFSCAAQTCLRLHNGAMLWYWSSNEPFYGTSSTHALSFFIDPDGRSTDTISGTSVQLFLYYNGRITSRANITNPTWTDNALFTPNTAYEPDWFSW